MRGYRNELLNTEKLLEIKQKLNNRPVANTIRHKNTVVLPKHGAIEVDGCANQMYILDPKSSRIELVLSSKEPRDHIHVRISSQGLGKVNVQETIYTLESNNYPLTLDVSVDYSHMYEKEIVKMKQQEAIDNS